MPGELCLDTQMSPREIHLLCPQLMKRHSHHISVSILVENGCKTKYSDETLGVQHTASGLRRSLLPPHIHSRIPRHRHLGPFPRPGGRPAQPSRKTRRFLRGTELFNAATENGRLLNQFCHVTGPIDESPEHCVQVELLRVRDAALRRILPGPLYKVISAEPFLDAAGHFSQSLRRGGGICVEDMQLVGSYVSPADARARANRELVARLVRYPAAFPKLVTAVEEGRDAMGIIIAFEGGSAPTVPFVVMVSYDSGVMLDSRGNEM